MLRPLRIGITSGDPQGIGPEVVAKALKKIGPIKNVQFFLWRNSFFPQKDFNRISREFKVSSAQSWNQALYHVPDSAKVLVDITSTVNPAYWVKEAGSACFFRHLDAVVTAPLSKPTIQAAKMGAVGQTEILRAVANNTPAFMSFLGEHFNVLVATGHLPIKAIASEFLSTEKLKAAIESAIKLNHVLTKLEGKKKPGKIGVLGLNPHSGDAGILGDEEVLVINQVIESYSEQGVMGPLVPDAAFVKSKREEISLYVALYHDQGLIPFKALHGQDGIHLTWGLPFIRTSVDHGTAFDIAGKDMADPSSMISAIKWAIKLAKANYNGI